LKIVKYIWIVSVITLILNGESLEISADNFTHIEQKHKAVFEGHAYAKEGNSTISADRLIVYFDDKNRAKEYQAIGSVHFEIIKPKQDVEGSCQKLIYNVVSDTYKMVGNAKLIDKINHREMEGEEVYLDNKHKEASAKSDKKGPVKFIFKMKDIKNGDKSK